MSGAVAHSTQNTLRKLGADLRWFVEKNGVDPQKATVMLCVESLADRDKLIDGFGREYEGEVMKRWAHAPFQIMVHGIGIAIVVKEPA